MGKEFEQAVKTITGMILFGILAGIWYIWNGIRKTKGENKNGQD